MAVAVKNSPDSATRSMLGSLVPASIVGAVFILLCAAVVFWGIPRIWELGPSPYLTKVPFISVAGLIVVEIVTIGILAFVGIALAGPTPPRGLRRGVFTVLVWLFLTGFVTVSAGGVLQSLLGGASAVGIDPDNRGCGWLALLGMVADLPARKRRPCCKLSRIKVGSVATRLKPMQGQRVRRATMLGIILLVAAGIWSLLSHGTLNTVDNTWAVSIPFTNYILPLLPDVRFTVPLLLAAAGLWLSFRVVHLPVFADFLIATEAELNKVSWPTRRSVVQDTVVVLTTVLLLTLFLFLVDVGWGWLLSRDVVGVIRQSETPTPTQQTQVDKTTPY